MTLRKGKVWSKSFVTEQRCVNTRQEVTLRFCHIHLERVHISVWDRKLKYQRREWIKKNAIKLFFTVVSSKPTFPPISKLYFEVAVECRKSDDNQYCCNVIDRIELTILLSTIHALSRSKKKTIYMKIIEKIKNEENLSHSLPVSMKCGLR